MGPATTTPTKTANAHAAVMTIQPAFWDFDLASRTPATTASPSRTRSPVPNTSAMKILVSQTMLHSLDWWGRPPPQGPLNAWAGSAVTGARRARGGRGTPAGSVAPPLAPPFAHPIPAVPLQVPRTGERACPQKGVCRDARQRGTREPSRLRETRAPPGRNRPATDARQRADGGATSARRRRTGAGTWLD